MACHTDQAVHVRACMRTLVWCTHILYHSTTSPPPQAATPLAPGSGTRPRAARLGPHADVTTVAQPLVTPRLRGGPAPPPSGCTTLYTSTTPCTRTTPCTCQCTTPCTGRALPVATTTTTTPATSPTPHCTFLGPENEPRRVSALRLCPPPLPALGRRRRQWYLHALPHRVPDPGAGLRCAVSVAAASVANARACCTAAAAAAAAVAVAAAATTAATTTTTCAFTRPRLRPPSSMGGAARTT